MDVDVNKINELLDDIANLALAAKLQEDEAVKRQALAYIAAAVSNIIKRDLAPLPSEVELHEAATEEPCTSGCPSLVPGKVVVHDEPAPIIAKRNYKRQRISYPGGLSTTIEKEGRKLVGVITHTGKSYDADVYENGELLFSIATLRGKSFTEHVLRKAMLGAAIALTHSMRNRKNRKARRAAARRQEDDDLAQRMENA